MLNVRIRSVEKRTTRARDKKKPTRNNNPPPPEIVIPALHKNESATAINYMFRYKIGRARRPLTIRNGVYNYGVDRCPDWSSKTGRCPRGNKCRFAHGSLETLFHPLYYKRSMCTKKSCKQGEACAWAHASSEIRVLRTLLGTDWMRMDPVSLQESRDVRRKRRAVQKAKRAPPKVKLLQPTRTMEGDVPSVRSSMSVVSSRPESKPEAPPSPLPPPPRRTESPPWSSTPTMDKMSVVSSSASSQQQFPEREETVAEKKEVIIETTTIPPPTTMMTPIADAKSTEASRDFAFWFESEFDIEREDLPHGGYLKRFLSTGLGDAQLLWELYLTMPGKLSDLLVNEVGMTNGVKRGVFMEKLCRYVHPMDVCEWMDRIVGLPQYTSVFEVSDTMEQLAYERLDDDALVEMGISSAGHRIKILYYLRKFEKEMRELEIARNGTME